MPSSARSRCFCQPLDSRHPAYPTDPESPFDASDAPDAEACARGAAPGRALPGGDGLPLDVVESSVRLLCAGPSPLAVDGRALGHGMPRRLIRVTELTAILLHPSTDYEARDAVWRRLVEHARDLGPAWVVAAVAVASPRLRTVATRLGRPRDADVQAELVAGFLAALPRLDLERPGVCGRLCNAAQAHARRQLRAASAGAGTAAPAPSPRRARGGHPDLVLARAVAAGVLTTAEADLIAATRLDGTPLTRYAVEIGASRWAVYKRRATAEARLAHAATTGALDPLGDVLAEATGHTAPDPAPRSLRDR